MSKQAAGNAVAAAHLREKGESTYTYATADLERMARGVVGKPYKLVGWALQVGAQATRLAVVYTDLQGTRSEAFILL